ncbi:urease accessory protein UreD [Sphingobacterium spiritivorum]|uniref:urease accessory protein UreD n=1 Tax=Sphingobacterium spiritivorum TaxID=258 RepID=UPI003DA53444
MESSIKINVEREGTYSVLKESYHNAPYKLTHYGSPRAQEHLEMIIMSASPGIMDEDHLTIDVRVKKDACFKLFTQSFNKLHPMKKGATQDTIIKLEANSIMQYVPHPVTPFKDAIFRATNRIDMHETATLIWGDIISAGRIYMNEAFQFQKVHSRTTLYRDGKLIYTDNQCLMPHEQPVRKLLFFENYTHQAAFIYSGPFAKLMKEEFDEILAGSYEDITFGFTYCADNSILLRALGYDGELLYSFLTMLSQMCWEFTQHQQQLLMNESVLPAQETQEAGDTEIPEPKAPAAKRKKSRKQAAA